MKQYRSEIAMVCHQDAEAMYKIGAISAERMREYDEDCLIHEPELAIVDPEADQIAEPQPAEVNRDLI